MLELAHEYGGDLVDCIKSTENCFKKAFGQLIS
jgi:hypothetical protein